MYYFRNSKCQSHFYSHSKVIHTTIMTKIMSICQHVSKKIWLVFFHAIYYDGFCTKHNNIKFEIAILYMSMKASSGEIKRLLANYGTFHVEWRAKISITYKFVDDN